MCWHTPHQLHVRIWTTVKDLHGKFKTEKNVFCSNQTLWKEITSSEATLEFLDKKVNFKPSFKILKSTMDNFQTEQVSFYRYQPAANFDTV